MLAMKERAKLQRKEAYRKAKEARKTDPVFLAMKAKAKENRREAYQAAKERHKARVTQEKAQLVAAEEDERTKRRAVMDEALMQLIRRERQA
jgi:hypothetical protein